jgi:hypothetical protein
MSEFKMIEMLKTKSKNKEIEEKSAQFGTEENSSALSAREEKLPNYF